MSIRLLQRVLRNGTKFIFADRRYIYQYRSIQKLAFRKSTHQKSILAEANVSRESNNNITRFSRRLIVDNVLNRVTSPKSSVLRTEATKRFAFGDSLPFLSLVGCSLASGNGLITKEDELESVCWEIREAVLKYQTKLEGKVIENRFEKDIQLNDLQIGPLIATGCSGVVYATKFKKDTECPSQKNDIINANENNSQPYFSNNPSDINLFGHSKNLAQIIQNIGDNVAELQSGSSVQEYEENTKNGVHEIYNDSIISHLSRENLDSSIYNYPWALKMMFNYEIQSNAISILRAMYKETIPCNSKQKKYDQNNWEKQIDQDTLKMPPHPNIVLMPAFFCATVPELENSKTIFPNALPPRLNPLSGYGRNMSLFLLMKRYNCSLREYLDEFSDTHIRTRIILFAQLLEAIAHINNFQIAHRDLKSDNILIDTTSDSLPLLVLSDFGCCIADKNHGLRIPYQSNEIDKGGNIQLMAPEIVLKQPSLFAILDYTKSDLWAAGTIAYEIFGYPNPFYNDSSRNAEALRNLDYDDASLPQLDNDEIPYIVKKLIENMLQRSPRKRLTCDVAANIIELYLWAPSLWIKYNRVPSNNEILEWLLSLTTKILCERGLGFSNDITKSRRTYTEYILISTFLSRANLKNIKRALEWIRSLESEN